MAMANCEDGNDVGVKLPIGFRFRPTDEEVLIYYLNRKICSLPLPAAAITDFDVFHSSPWDLPGDLKEKRYFFCKRRSRSSFSTDCGYWKAIGRCKQIMAPGCNDRIIGIKKSFVFCHRKKKSPPEQNTQWVMHELSFVASINTPFLSQKVMVQVGEWVVCCVHQRRKKKARNHMNLQRMESNNDQQWGFSSSSSSSSTSSCSGISEISIDELDQEESSDSVSF